MSSIEENIELVKEFFNYTNNNIESLTDINNVRDFTLKYMSHDFINHHPLGDLTLEQDQQAHAMFFKGFPNTQIEIEDIFGADDKVFARVRVTGTHTGEFQGYPITGKQYNVTEAWVFRVSDGKFVEAWNFVNMLTMYNQLGITPPSQ